MNSHPAPKRLPPSVRMAAVRAANANYEQVISNSITKYRMGLVEKTFLRIAAAFVVLAMRLRQRRTEAQLQKPTETFANHTELNRFLASRLAGIQSGKRN